MFKTGPLDRKISIERKTSTRDDHGQPIESWTRIGATRSAAKFPVSGTERFIADQFVGREQDEFQVRWTTDIADVSPLDRVVYPVTVAPTDDEIFDIIAVHEIGWRVGLRIITARRAET